MIRAPAQKQLVFKREGRGPLLRSNVAVRRAAGSMPALLVK